MILNHEINHNEHAKEKIPLVFIHGLFGSLSNLGMIAREFYKSQVVIQVDVRNHGHSPRSSEMDYLVMAQDILDTLDLLEIEKFSVIGHSMGGKIAMQLTAQASERVEQIVVLDIAPIAYTENHHDQVFKALFAVQDAKIETRLDATKIMREYLDEEMVIQFLMKSFHKGQWLFNVEELFHHYTDILGWHNVQICHKEILFIRGGDSSYMSQDQHFQAVMHQFSNAQIKVIENAGHWLHAEKPQQVIDEISRYMEV